MSRGASRLVSSGFLSPAESSTRHLPAFHWLPSYRFMRLYLIPLAKMLTDCHFDKFFFLSSGPTTQRRPRRTPLSGPAWHRATCSGLRLTSHARPDVQPLVLLMVDGPARQDPSKWGPWGRWKRVDTQKREGGLPLSPLSTQIWQEGDPQRQGVSISTCLWMKFPDLRTSWVSCRDAQHALNSHGCEPTVLGGRPSWAGRACVWSSGVHPWSRGYCGREKGFPSRRFSRCGRGWPWS